MEKMMECPFCKSPDIFVELRADGAQIKDAPLNLSYSAICRKCQARGPVVLAFGFPKSEQPLTTEAQLAIAKDKQRAVSESARLWNRR